MADTSTTKISGKYIMVTWATNIGDVDWNLTTHMSDFVSTGLRVKAIQFVPSAANDVMVIRNSPATSTTAAEIFNVKCADTTDQRREYHDSPSLPGTQMWPMVDVSACTITTVANARLLIEIA